MDDLISRKALLAAYDAAHKGPPGGARKLIEEAPTVMSIVRKCTCEDEIAFDNCKGCTESDHGQNCYLCKMR